MDHSGEALRSANGRIGPLCVNASAKKMGGIPSQSHDTAFTHQNMTKQHWFVSSSLMMIEIQRSDIVDEHLHSANRIGGVGWLLLTIVIPLFGRRHEALRSG